MSFRTRRVILSSPFYAILSYLVLSNVFSLFGGKENIYIYMIVLILMAIQIVPMIFEEKKSTSIGRFFSKCFGIWEWILTMLIIYSSLLFIIGLFISIPVNILYCIFLTIPIIGVYSYYNAHRIVVKEKEIVIDNIKKEYNIVHLSDVHFGSVMHKELIKKIADKLDSLSDTCDLAIISGDLADGSCKVEEDDFIELKKIKMPIIFTSGNHDYYQKIGSVHKACRNADIIVLENNRLEFDDLNIYGLSYSFDEIEMPSKEELEKHIEEDKVNILNYHIPNGWKEFSNLGFNIQLSGHTHGGQFYPVIYFGNLVYEGHNMGLFSDEMNHYLHVTTGVGCMDFPMRWGTNSELVILKLRKH